MNSVFISGLGAITSVGLNLEETWQAIKAGQSGIAPISGWDIEAWPYHLGGEVKGFQPKKQLWDKKLIKMISAHDAMGIVAASQAVEDANLMDYRDSLSDATHFSDRSGVYVGSPGNKFYQQYDFLPLLADTDNMQAFGDKLFEHVHPMWLLRSLPNNVLAYAGIQFNFKGPNQNVVNHVASGMQALIEAFYAVQMGLADRAVVIAYDLGFEPEAQMSYGQLGILSDTALRPFDARHNGTVLAEGACALVLESEISLNERQGHAYAQICAGSTTNDAQGIFSIDKEAKQLMRVIKQTLEKANVQAENIGALTAHANGNVPSDITEAKAVQAVLPKVPVTGFKWSTGHSLANSGLLDTVLTAKAMSSKSIPGLAYLEQLAPECESLNVDKQARSWQEPYGMVVSRGFGGLNTAILLKCL